MVLLSVLSNIQSSLAPFSKVEILALRKIIANNALLIVQRISVRTKHNRLSLSVVGDQLEIYDDRYLDKNSRNLFQVIWELFPDEILERLLEGITVKSDNDRLLEVKFDVMTFQLLKHCLVTNCTAILYSSIDLDE